MRFVNPTLDYALLAPILIVLGGALLGVLVEAFGPRASRAASQLFITLATLALSLASLIKVRGRSSAAAAMESVTFDGAGVLLQGSILIISIIAVFLLADQENFTALAAALPGSDEERTSLQQDLKVTEVYPLTLFAVAGML
ncbi:MAG: NADH-quinone oxidoreductase subunit N, partial [Actinobacteria bacterium]|nr:NADH-quinone oxidoreductase subunit N [Actinomycetota bacterium]